MPARKMRVEIFDSNGNRYTVTLEGQITREKALRLLDLVELLGGIPSSPNPSLPSSPTQLSKYEKVRFIIERHYPLVWFSSREIQTSYEQEFKEPIALSTVATYLSRLHKRGFLAREGSSTRIRYRMVTVTSKVLQKMGSNR
ncbi:hypothetical protein DRO50_01820 [Candidatus Bathyarchaeota archaeon]|nr:MAG: hypothetical protein DRO50_01820 [Candidatus Bathyarchaeota archaeon]